MLSIPFDGTIGALSSSGGRWAGGFLSGRRSTPDGRGVGGPVAAPLRATSGPAPGVRCPSRSSSWPDRRAEASSCHRWCTPPPRSPRSPHGDGARDKRRDVRASPHATGRNRADRDRHEFAMNATATMMARGWAAPQRPTGGRRERQDPGHPDPRRRDRPRGGGCRAAHHRGRRRRRSSGRSTRPAPRSSRRGCPAASRRRRWTRSRAPGSRSRARSRRRSGSARSPPTSRCASSTRPTRTCGPSARCPACARRTRAAASTSSWSARTSRTSTRGSSTCRRRASPRRSS